MEASNRLHCSDNGERLVDDLKLEASLLAKGLTRQDALTHRQVERLRKVGLRSLIKILTSQSRDT